MLLHRRYFWIAKHSSVITTTSQFGFHWFCRPTRVQFDAKTWNNSNQSVALRVRFQRAIAKSIGSFNPSWPSCCSINSIVFQFCSKNRHNYISVGQLDGTIDSNGTAHFEVCVCDCHPFSILYKSSSSSALLLRIIFTNFLAYFCSGFLFWHVAFFFCLFLCSIVTIVLTLINVVRNARRRTKCGFLCADAFRGVKDQHKNRHDIVIWWQ